MKRSLPAVLVVFVIALFAAGSLLRGQLDVEIDAGSMESFQASLQDLRAWIVGLGWPAPAIFIGLVTFRVFLLLPSAVVLTVGGLAFGSLFGTLLGTVGIFLSAALKFAIARGAGRDVLKNSLGDRFLEFEARVERAGVWLVGVVTAHPAAPMSSVHWAAGLSSMSFLGFAAAVMVSGPVRAAVYSVLGSSIVELEWTMTVGLAAALLAVALLPLAHRGLRQRLLGSRPTG
ncbi:MAG: TVP38/TMEM64 family protein [Deltaproteobacteria bacterium]|nr:TVP38/TMEM64 family protein [Deltaproteobacteria bacterium]MBW2415910.1 TVP38/TMEM64 family protein [Deltaproteobacteria bacterium]